MKYEVTRIFDASNGQTVEADTPEEAVEIAANDDAARAGLCHQCSREVNLGDHVRTIVYDERGDEVYDDGFEAMEIKRLRTENAKLKAELLSIDGALDDPRSNLTLTTAEIIWELKAQLDAQRTDAERYQVLRDSKYQLDEDDPCVSDSFFDAYFEEKLDLAVDKLKARYDAAMKEKT